MALFKFFYTESYAHPFIGAYVVSQWNTEASELLCWWKIKSLKRESKDEVIDKFKNACKILTYWERWNRAYTQYDTNKWQVEDYEWQIMIDKKNLKIISWSLKYPMIEYGIMPEEFNELEKLYLGQCYNGFLKSMETKEQKAKNKFFGWVKKKSC